MLIGGGSLPPQEKPAPAGPTLAAFLRDRMGTPAPSGAAASLSFPPDLGGRAVKKAEAGHGGGHSLPALTRCPGISRGAQGVRRAAGCVRRRRPSAAPTPPSQAPRLTVQGLSRCLGTDPSGFRGLILLIRFPASTCAA